MILNSFLGGKLSLYSSKFAALEIQEGAVSFPWSQSTISPLCHFRSALSNRTEDDSWWP